MYPGGHNLETLRRTPNIAWLTSPTHQISPHPMSKPKEASDVVATYGWPEPSVGSSTSGTLYNVVSREIGGEITYFRVGDVALFEAEGSAPPYVGVIEKLWESPDSEMLLTARWFFRPSDCPSGLLLSSEVRSNELFYSSQVCKRLEFPALALQAVWLSDGPAL